MEPDDQNQRPTMVRTVYEGEVFSHRVLWRAAQQMRQQAESGTGDPTYFEMAAILFARLTCEAYCNFLLDVLYPDTFAVERQTFGSSIDAKVQWLCDQLGCTLDLAARPFQTIQQLNSYRDDVVHAKPVVYDGEHSHPVGVDSPFMKPRGLLAESRKALRIRALEDVSRLCEAIHEKAIAKAKRGRHPTQSLRLQTFALEGVTQIQSGSTGLAPMLAAVAAAFIAYSAGESLPEFNEGPVVAYQTSALSGSLSYSASLILPDGLRVSFD